MKLIRGLGRCVRSFRRVIPSGMVADSCSFLIRLMVKLLGGDQRGRVLVVCRASSHQSGFMSVLDSSEKSCGASEHHIICFASSVRRSTLL